MEKYRVLICGDRNWTAESPIEMVIKWFPKDECIIVNGGARGADLIADRVARRLGYEVHCYPADWDRHGRAAGPIRNQQMLDEEHPQMVFAFHNDIENSKGTADMVRRARKAGVEVKIKRFPE